MDEDLECGESFNVEPGTAVPTTITRVYLMFLFLWQVTFKVSDVGMTVLFKFLSMFLSLLGMALRSQSLKVLADSLPKSVAGGKRVLGTSEDKFSKLVCCPDCKAIYEFKDCFEKLPNGKMVSKVCPFVKFPRHPHRSRRKPCGATLLKTVRTSHGSTVLYPHMLYCYKSLIESLQELLLRPNFFTNCEHWRKRSFKPDTLSDVYDGQLWRDFLYYDGKPFLAAPFNFALSLNVDWFQPFKHTAYSVGAMYIAIQNLPRNMRFLAENVILVGIIPGPSEPHLTMNTFLEPLVKDLMNLWNGVVMKSNLQSSVLVRAALLCVACDIPASRKVCGFVGHTALKACTKCLKDFPTQSFGTPPDYGGFDRENWAVRTNSTHRQHAIDYRSCITQREQNAIVKQHGCRYSLLLTLPYFDPIRMCVIDPMHNLLLGTARHMLSIWKESKVITEEMWIDIQKKVNSFITTDDIGRIPSKIASGFAGLTADQLKNWTLIYSLFSLKEHLHYEHFQCWHLFVKACNILCRRSVKLEAVNEADRLMLEFCRKFEVLYGRSKCNINLHLHTHLSMCIRDHGPVYAFWLFSFERLNGILGSFHTNSRDVSLQLMRRFLYHEYAIQHWPVEYQADFGPLLSNCQYSKGSLMSALDSSECKPLPPVRESAFSPEFKSRLERAFCLLCQNECFNRIQILSLHERCKAVQVGEHVLGSQSSRHKTASIVFVRTFESTESHLAEVQYYFRFHVQVASYTPGISDETRSYWFAAVTLFQPHPCKVWFGSPTEVWSQVASFNLLLIPVEFIKSRTVHTSCTVNFGRHIGEQNVLVVVPIINDLYSDS